MIRTALLMWLVTCPAVVGIRELAAQQKPTRRDSAAETHWAFRRFGLVKIPAVRNPRELRSPIDAFVSARLEAAGLDFAAEADRRTRKRRLYLDHSDLTYSLNGRQETLTDVDVTNAQVVTDLLV